MKRIILLATILLFIISTPCFGTRPIKKGSTDQSIVIRIIDSTSGAPETGVEHDSGGIDLCDQPD